MYLLKAIGGAILITFILSISVLSFSKVSDAQAGKTVELNTRGACLKVDDFKALMKSEVKKMKAGDTIKLIIDTPNEKEANDAIKQEGHTITETNRNKDKDSTTYIIRVSK